MQIEVKGIYCLELCEPDSPADPTCCAVLMSADIGLVGTTGADRFRFHVVTPEFLAQNPEVRWGHGYLLMPEFSWTEVNRMLARIISRASAENWDAAAQKLCRYLEWEFDDYQQSAKTDG